MEKDLFTYKINDFEGPLDLLLSLITKNKIDIYDIPIATLTDEYIQFIENNNNKNMETLSEFIVMASTLISIKYKMLLPRKIEESVEEVDPRSELVNSLVEYKKIKEVVKILKEDYDGKIFTKNREDKSIAEIIEAEDYDVEDILKDVTLQGLYSLFKDVMDRNEKKEVKIKHSFKNVKREEFTVVDKKNYIIEFMKEKDKVLFIDLFENDSSRNEKITTFLAILELIKSSVIYVSQSENFGHIYIKSNYKGNEIYE